MAQRRMFSPQIIDSDAFLDMPASTQALYFHLSMRADDDGFVGNPKKILRTIGGSEDDLKILIAKRFILVFESGVIVIKHWRINNLIRKDWYKETTYIEEKNQLEIKNNGAYTELVNENATNRLRRLDKVRLGKVSLIKEKEEKNKYAEDVELTEKEYESLKERLGDNRERAIEILSNYKGSTGKKYKSDYKAILGWVTDKITKEGGKANQPNREEL